VDIKYSPLVGRQILWDSRVEHIYGVNRNVGFQDRRQQRNEDIAIVGVSEKQLEDNVQRRVEQFHDLKSVTPSSELLIINYPMAEFVEERADWACLPAGRYKSNDDGSNVATGDFRRGPVRKHVQSPRDEPPWRRPSSKSVTR
jgi:hypothetical protein